MRFASVRQRLADFFALPRVLGATWCLWCGDDDAESFSTMYWKYGWQIVPFRADLCSIECVKELSNHINEADYRVRDDIEQEYLGDNE